MNAGLQLPHGPLDFPVFLPDATRGVVRGVDSADLETCGVHSVVMNTFHLMQHPGSSTIQALGGLHKMFGWSRPIFTDSGGFQVYSLIRQNPAYGSLGRKGATFRPNGASRKLNLTPEKSIRLQIAYGADALFCLDDCTHVNDPLATQRESVARTIHWARRCKTEFERLVEQKELAPEERPLLFAVIQGGGERDLRRACAEALLEIGFDGFGYGGWPLDDEGHLLTEMLACVRELVPRRYPLHALGVAHPVNVVACARLGYDLFDGAMPTRDARHGRLYTFLSDGLEGEWFDYTYVQDSRHIKSDTPISDFCDCLCCTRYSLGYLHHLFKINESLYMRLATIHNLRFMVQLTERIRRLRLHGLFPEQRDG